MTKQSKMGGTVHKNFHIPRSIWRQIEEKAIREECNLSEAIRKILTAWARAETFERSRVRAITDRDMTLDEYMADPDTQ